MLKKIQKNLENGKPKLIIFIFSVAPFNSILERDKAYRMNEYPGPGTYATETVKVVKTIEDKPHNSF